MVVEAAIASVARKETVGGAKLEDSSQQRTALNDLRSAYLACVERARLAAVSNPTMLTRLGIPGRIPTEIGDLILGAETYLQVVA